APWRRPASWSPRSSVATAATLDGYVRRILRWLGPRQTGLKHYHSHTRPRAHPVYWTGPDLPAAAHAHTGQSTRARPDFACPGAGSGSHYGAAMFRYPGGRA